MDLLGFQNLYSCAFRRQEEESLRVALELSKQEEKTEEKEEEAKSSADLLLGEFAT